MKKVIFCSIALLSFNSASLYAESVADITKFAKANCDEIKLKGEISRDELEL
jgi:hypothetical protein